MLALADPPTAPSGMIPGLKYPPEWHRRTEETERTLLDEHIRRHLRSSLRSARFPGGTR